MGEARSRRSIRSSLVPILLLAAATLAAGNNGSGGITTRTGESGDAAGTRRALTHGLRNRSVNCRAISRDGRHLSAATEKEGCCRLDLAGAGP